MGVRTWRQLLTAGITCGALISPAVVDAQGRAKRSSDGIGSDPTYVIASQNVGRGTRATPNLVHRSDRAGVDPYATGYERGHEKGVEDGRNGDRYDPLRHRSYRDGDEGYSSDYGSRDAYRNNYRAGFRQGYEEGYRQGSRNRR